MTGFALKVYGCQMNVYDSDKIRTSLIRKGWTEVDEDSADIVIYNGCSIRQKAEHKVWSHLGRYQDRWESQGLPLVAVTGCIAQNIGREMMERFPWVKLISGPRHIGFLPSALEKVLSGEGAMILLDDGKSFDELQEVPLERHNPWKAYVTIAHGCDNFCTYCIVPYVRGRFLSREPRDILEEVSALVHSGVKEITLLGQNVNSYGSDFKNGYTFADLLSELADLKEMKRLRFVTSHPKDFTEDILRVMKDKPVICPAINLPIQSGSDRILKRMNRKYTLEQYRKTVSMIREYLPECGLTSDLIVGFPGETEDDFRESLDAIETFRYDQVHTASYSPREGTAGAKMEDQVPETLKKERLAIINDRQAEIAFEINSQLVGREYVILVDDIASKGGNSLLQGRTSTDKVVILEGPEELKGAFVKARIKKAEYWCLRGEFLEVVPDEQVNRIITGV